MKYFLPVLGLLMGACATFPLKEPPVSSPRPHPTVSSSTVKSDSLLVSPKGTSVPEEKVSFSEPPTYLAARSNPNDYRFLADGGETFGFSVGYGRSWVVLLPPIPEGSWDRAFVGAKLGAMKTERKPGRPDWDQRVIPGEIFAAVTQSFPCLPHRRYPLVRTEDIPLAGHPRQPLDGVGEARWFWTEIPLSSLSFEVPNIVVIYSPSETLKGEDHSPVLAGARVEDQKIAWWRDQSEGRPPRTSAEAFQFPAVTYTPAVALKLVPSRTGRPQVVLPSSADGFWSGKNLVVGAAVKGTNIDSAWLEISSDGRSWTRMGRPLRGAPYVFTIADSALPKGPFKIRVSARDSWESVGTSSAVPISPQ
jgi:hypothetical protein